MFLEALNQPSRAPPSTLASGSSSVAGAALNTATKRERPQSPELPTAAPSKKKKQATAEDAWEVLMDLRDLAASNSSEYTDVYLGKNQEIVAEFQAAVRANLEAAKANLSYNEESKTCELSEASKQTQPEDRLKVLATLTTAQWTVLLNETFQELVIEQVSRFYSSPDGKECYQKLNLNGTPARRVFAMISYTQEHHLPLRKLVSLFSRLEEKLGLWRTGVSVFFGLVAQSGGKRRGDDDLRALNLPQQDSVPVDDDDKIAIFKTFRDVSEEHPESLRKQFELTFTEKAI